jgi:diguanylate cyclase (GGDEF)-like protein
MRKQRFRVWFIKLWHKGIMLWVRQPWRWTITITLLLWYLNTLGALQWCELLSLDQILKQRPPLGTDPHITIVGITETDLKQQNGWPISDAHLAQAIDHLQTHHPRVIALDLYRDIPILEGQASLQQRFQTDSNVLGVEKLLGVPVSPPPGLPVDRIGFSDLVLDPDSVLRRALLSAKGKQSLGALAALTYLKTDRIAPQPIPHTDRHLRLGHALITPLSRWSGAYTTIDTAGYQIFLNFRGEDCISSPRTCQGFEIYSFNDLLQDRIPSEALQERLVFVGVVAASLQDVFKTPYTASNDLTSGVVIHAHIASQLIDAALGQRPLFQFWPQWVEFFWLLGWTAITVHLGFRLFHARWNLFIIVPSLCLLLGILWQQLLLAHYWVPFILPFVSIILSGAMVQWRVLWCSLRQSYDTLARYTNTLEAQVIERTRNLTQEIERHRTTTLELKQANQKLRSLVLLDGLTQVANRRHFDEYFQEMWQHSFAQERPLSIILCDIDHFKAYNDTYGHQAGDQCIQTIAQILRDCVTSPQLVARYGGEEFVIILPYIDLQEVIQVVCTIQKKVNDAHIPHSASPTASCVTLSLGISTIIPQKEFTPEALLLQADQALYRAKNSRRNRFAIYIPLVLHSGS